MSEKIRRKWHKAFFLDVSDQRTINFESDIVMALFVDLGEMACKDSSSSSVV